jgi:hypothetical protein
MVQIRTFDELHRQFLDLIIEFEKVRKAVTGGHIARLLNTNTRTVRTHAKVSEMYGKIKVVDSNRGTLIVPSSVVIEEKLDKSGENENQ